MKVINKDFLPVCIEIAGVRYIIPGDKSVCFLPDSAFDAFKELFYIVEPPIKKEQEFIPLETFLNKSNPTLPLIRNLGKGNKKYIYTIIDSLGNVQKVRSLRKFCLERGLKYDMYYNACKKGKTYKGYTITRELNDKGNK